VKIYSILILVTLNATIAAMNSDTNAPIIHPTFKFEHSNFIMKKLTDYDKAHNENYRVIAQTSGFHFILAHKPHSLSAINKLLDVSFKQYNPNMTTDEIIRHRNQIVHILCSNEAPSTKSKL